MSQEIVTKPHPYIEGLLVRSDGMVYLPKSGGHNARWTKGCCVRHNNIIQYYELRFKNRRYYTHRLIAETFIPNIENKPYVIFKDGNKSNIVADNLYWSDYSENAKKASTTCKMNNTKRSILFNLISNITDSDDNFNRTLNKVKAKIRYNKPEYKEKHIKKSTQYRINHKDEHEFKLKHSEYNKKWRKTHQEYKEIRKEKYKNYKDNPNYREKHKKSNKSWYDKHKDDPDFKKKNYENTKMQRAKKKAQALNLEPLDSNVISN